MADDFYPAVSFHFKVLFPFDPQGTTIDVSFQSVSGLDSTLETEPIKEGGENRFTHIVPVRRKYGPLVLKRGWVSPDWASTLTDKMEQFFTSETFTPFDVVTIHLLDETHQPLLIWSVNNVWPLSWKISELNAQQGEVLIETLELNYNQLILND
jgi:phage tail-like protein